MYILSDEFSRQASMEDELKIPTSLMVRPSKDMVTLGKSQLGFMNLFALPLFQGVADLLPGMQYCVDELESNKALFETKVAEAQSQMDPASRLPQRDGSFSPRTMSMAVPETKKASLPAQKLIAASASALLASRTASERQFMTEPADPADTPAHVPVLSMSAEYKETKALVTNFDTVADFAASDPFNSNDGRHPHAEKQRCSETTEGSSAPYSLEWASGATSATTGKMPLSPSTQGTSVISRDSMDRPVSVPVTTVTAAESTTTATESARSRTDLKLEDNHSHSSAGDDQSSPERNDGTLRPPDAEPCQTLKKRPSRFRINGFHLFRRHKGTGAPASTSDTAG